MADRDDTSKPRSGRNQTESSLPADSKRASSDSPTKTDPLLHSPLVQAIEAERAELLRAHSLLKCLYEVLLNADHDDAVNHADAANVAARLIDESVTRLDIVRLAPMMEALRRGSYEPAEEKLTLGFSGKNEVKDEGPPPAYWS